MTADHSRSTFTASQQRATLRRGLLRIVAAGSFSSPLKILIVLACAHLTTQLPAFARPYDSNSSLREVRQTANGQDSVNASKFILTMYNDIVSRPTTNANDLQPNIVRSINSIQGVYACGVCSLLCFFFNVLGLLIMSLLTHNCSISRQQL